MMRQFIKSVASIVLLILASSSHAALVGDDIIAMVNKISELYGDGQASLVKKSIIVKEVYKENSNSCVTLLSFSMEGFSGGNNTAQFIAFLTCQQPEKAADANHVFQRRVVGVHPFYHHRNRYDVSSAVYENQQVVISSPAGKVSFTNKFSIWWSQTEQLSI